MAEKKPTTGQNAIHFGTDGWRALLDKDFNLETLGQVTAATGQAFRQLRETAPTSLKSVADAIPEIDRRANTLIVGYDCRRQAGQYAAFVASILADQGFEVIVSDRYCPTPALCWTISRRPEALGGIMLTSSHNAAEYLGVKLRMNDGGASPAWFTDQVESLLSADQHRGFAQAAQAFAAAVNGTPDSPARTLPGATWRYADLMSAYLADLATLVQAEVIRTAQLAVVVDPLYGAGRGYLAGLLREMGVQVTEIHGENDPTFGGLHPEPILPWVAAGAAKVVELGAAAVLINDGDADRIGAIDGLGNYVSSHRIISLLIAHLVEDRGLTGRVVRTSAGSNLIKRQCQRLGLELVTRPIGFKWVYQEMLRGDVLIGGEESG
ncbi:MAG: hypothetical protein FWC59_01655, partial [Actinomycetia bacterium]|nr:hypothetical protein [Actinomycetes bacterium]